MNHSNYPITRLNYPITKLPDYPIRVAVSMGSNVGDRRAHLDFAVARLAGFLDDLRISTYLETTPVEISGEQPDFLNAAATGTTALPPHALLAALLAVESEQGRERPFRHAPRTLDLDLVLFGDRIIDEPGLIVPHPRFRDRVFVLQPLAEIAPDFVDPITGRTVGELLRLLPEEARG
jgi:2-amino-4-hydroxy-6-hydroxymethyldihydropteridine diphosphokinase